MMALGTLQASSEGLTHAEIDTVSKSHEYSHNSKSMPHNHSITDVNTSHSIVSETGLSERLMTILRRAYDVVQQVRSRVRLIERVYMWLRKDAG